MLLLGYAFEPMLVLYGTLSSASQVYKKVPELQESKASKKKTVSESSSKSIRHNWQHLKDMLHVIGQDLSFYFNHRAACPSFAGALLYFTVLSFAGQMITYLLFAGYNSFHVAVARTISVIFEISATWLAPWVMSRIGPIRSGIWFISWQMICLAGAGAALWSFKSPILAASGLVGGTVLSRVGLWGFDLSAQVIVQEVS